MPFKTLQEFLCQFSQEGSLTSQPRPVHENQPSQKRQAQKTTGTEKFAPVLGILTGERKLYMVLPAQPVTTKTTPPATVRD